MAISIDFSTSVSNMTEARDTHRSLSRIQPCVSPCSLSQHSDAAIPETK